MPLEELVRRNPVFLPMSAAWQARIIESASMRTLKKGEFLVHHGDHWPFVFMVISGTLNAVKESIEGRRLIILSLEMGELFWGLTFFDDDLIMPVAMEVNEDCRVALWERRVLLPAFLASGEAMWALGRLMVSRMQQASDIVEGLAFQPVASRLARLIVGRFGGIVNQPVARDLTLDEMAAMVGTSREHVCRILYRFANENLIEITRTEFVVKDPEGLQDLMDNP